MKSLNKEESLWQSAHVGNLQSGMTLIETMVSLGLFAVVLAASMSMYEGMTKQLSHVQRQDAKISFETRLTSLLRNSNLCDCNIGGTSPLSIGATDPIEISGLKSDCASATNSLYSASSEGFPLGSGLSVDKITIQSPVMIVDPSMHATLTVTYKVSSNAIQPQRAEFLLLFNKSATAGPPYEISSCSLGGSVNGNGGWNLAGNSDVNPSIHFFGTTNNTDVIFRRNNIPSGGIRASNVSLGLNSLVDDTTSTFVTAIGNQAMQHALGDGNTAIGTRAMANSTGGRLSVAIGLNALRMLNSGVSNVAIGNQAMQARTAGDANVAVGYEALHNGTGSGTTGCGFFRIRGGGIGGKISALGLHSLENTFSGSENVGIGYNAMVSNTSGSRNVAVGADADVSASGISNATAIGAGAVVTASNMVRIGDNAVTVIQGQVGFSSSSDERLKKDISDYKHGLDLILNLRPISYRFKSDKDNKIHSGFVAQEVEAIQVPFFGLNKPTSASSFYSLSYGEFVVPLVNAVKELYQMIQNFLRTSKLEIEELRAENQTLRNDLESLNKRQRKIEQHLCQQNKDLDLCSNLSQP